LTKFDGEDREREVERISVANQELIERNEELRREIVQLQAQK
jgi:hypothetical protein